VTPLCSLITRLLTCSVAAIYLYLSIHIHISLPIMSNGEFCRARRSSCAILLSSFLDSFVISLLSLALNRIRSTPPRIIASPPTQPRRAAVALVIRVTPPKNYPPIPPYTSQPSISDFFNLDWVNATGACPEILFLKRKSQEEDAAAIANNRLGNASEAHVAFPGGRTEEGDESASYTGLLILDFSCSNLSVC
jgi:hypothetical protein